MKGYVIDPDGRTVQEISAPTREQVLATPVPDGYWISETDPNAKEEENG